MLIEPQLDEVVNGARGMLAGIQACLDAQCLVSAVTLMFSSIDALAALTRPVGQTDTRGANFQEWVERFLHPDRRLNCTSLDLWGARCGVLHTYSPESTRAFDKGAKRIFYRWREGPAADAGRRIPANSLAIVIEDLLASLVDATHDYMAELATDAELEERLTAHLSSLLCYEPYPTIAVTTST